MPKLALKQDFDLAVQHHKAGRLQQAEQLYRQILGQQPKHAEATHLLGLIAHQMGQTDLAIDLIGRAIAFRPNFPEAYNNLGNALRNKGKIDEAIVAYRKAIGLNPEFAGAYNNLGHALKDKGQLDEAIAALRRALLLQPNYADAHSNLIFAMHYHPAFDARAIAEELRHWNRQHAEPLQNLIRKHTNDRDPDRRLRIGYVSPNFRDHVVAYNLLPLLLRHDRGQFEITCYAQLLRPDAITRQFQECSDRWRNTWPLSDDQMAEQIREDEIDILVDLALHTGHNRLLVFARKPAPVQVSYLGYCGNTGMRTMDYRLSDPYLDPVGAEEQYVEKTIRLPETYWCYQPKSNAPDVSQLPARQAGFVTFGCLNNFVKVSAPVLELWARLMQKAPGSRLLLYSGEGSHRDRTVRQLAQLGINADRVQFFNGGPWPEYMRQYHQIDIGLDPIPYGGGITTCDALWMGVPVVTLSGKTAVGRGGRSILSNLGLTELVAFTMDQYLQIAIDLASNLDRLQNLRQGMRARMQASPLMDAVTFSRDMEGIYRHMWRTYCESVGKGTL